MSVSRIASAAIKIPKRIERGPTDILKALASTVKHLPSEPDPLLHDDPYLLPIRPYDRNLYTLSRLSGKSTAKFILNKHPEMFFRDDAEPKVRSFMPPEEFREDMVFDEGDVRWCIENNDPVNAIIAYKTLEKADVKLTKVTLLDFFEMLCYTNEERMHELLDVQKDFFSKNLDSELVKQTWNTNGLASKIFNQIKEDPEAPQIYSAMIAGLSKYNEHAAAKQVFEDFKEFHQNDGLFPCAYDGLIRTIPKLNSSMESTMNALEDIVKHMEQHLVKPDLLVFNSILDVYRSICKDDTTLRAALKIINDMRALDIEPSLCSYHTIFSMLCRSRMRGSYLETLSQILDYIHANGNLMEIRDARDVEFLQKTMRNVAIMMNNLSLANKVHRIYMKSPNLFVSSAKRQNYLDTYFKLIITTERMEEILKFYTSYVPTQFRPSPDTYDALIDALDLYKADAETVKRVGLDVVQFRLADKIKEDKLFKQFPEYVEQLSQSMMSKNDKRARQYQMGS